MATFLDVTGLQYFSSIFVFLFTSVVVYAMLAWGKFLGNNTIINALIGLLSGIFVLISPLATNIVGTVAPLIVVVLLFVVLLNTASKMLGSDLESFPAMKGLFLVFVLIIVVVVAGVKVRDSIDVDKTSEDLSTSAGLIFHPKFLGTVLIFAVAVFTIALLASKGG